MRMKMNGDHFSFIASNPEIVEHTGQLLLGFLLKFHDGVDSFLIHVDIIGGPSLQVIDVVILADLKHQVGLFAVHLIKHLIKGVFLLICIVPMQLVHIEGEMWQHLVVECVEVLVLIRVGTVDLSKDIPERHEHPTFVQHVSQFHQGLLSWEEV